MTASADGIDPADLEACLRVLRELDALPVEHPDAVAVRARDRAALFKTVKQRRRAERRAAVLAADAAVTAATATGAPGRIDDETAGPAAAPGARTARAPARSSRRARATSASSATSRSTPSTTSSVRRCAARNHARRDARTDLRGRRALLTGGRAKIGMYIALRLLRDGAHTTITTRFPRDAARRFAAMADSADWLHRLQIVGIDLRDPAQVVALADEVAAEGPLDILVNNAAQTVRRSAAGYALLARAEAAPLPPGPLPPIRTLRRRPAARTGLPARRRRRRALPHWTPTPARADARSR